MCLSVSSSPLFASNLWRDTELWMQWGIETGTWTRWVCHYDTKADPKNNRHISEINSLVCVTKFPLSATMTSKWKICSLLNQQEHTLKPTKQWFDSLALAVLCCWLLMDKLTRKLPSARTQPGQPKPHLQKLYKYPDYCLHVNKYNNYYYFIYKYVIWCDYMKLTAWCF